MEPSPTTPGGDAPRPALYHESEFALEELTSQKRAQGASVHVAIPARDEEATIAEIVATVRRELMGADGLVDTLVVVDDASKDATAGLAAEAGAEVVAGPGEGKGEAMAVALSLVEPSRDALVVFLDGDVTGFGSHFVTGLVGPLLREPRLELVKARYERPLGPGGSGGGRVTELVAKPALSLFFPELSGFGQPLAGETALRASLAKELDLAGGYAVEVALLIDAYLLTGTDGLAEVDLGERRHRNRGLGELVPQSREVLAAVLARAGVTASSEER